MAKRVNFVRMFPDGGRTTQVMRRSAPQFMFCPNHHGLPRRFIHGRCTPLHCAQPRAGEVDQLPEDSNLKPYQSDLDVKPIGMEATAIAEAQAIATPEEAETHDAQNEEALALMRAIGRNNAREALFPAPKEVKKIELEPGKEEKYVEERLKQLLPKALHVKEFLLQFGSRADQNEIADEILDRTGFTRKPEKQLGQQAPIQITITSPLPWDAKTVNAPMTGQPSTALPSGQPE